MLLFINGIKIAEWLFIVGILSDAFSSCNKIYTIYFERIQPYKKVIMHYADL